MPKDIEICVPGLLLNKAALVLCETGLFEPENLTSFDLYNEYKRGCPRLRPSSWISPPCTLVLFSDTRCGLDPLLQNILDCKTVPPEPICSAQIMDFIPAYELWHIPLPRLPPLFGGLCQRFLDTRDDIAMIAAEQLVDGMDLDDGWCERNFGGNSNLEVFHLAIGLVAGKHSRIDDFSENMVTCFIPNDEEARRVRQIPGYE